MNRTTVNQQNTETNALYVRMRNRFDFSGNRTIGEFMTMKAIREGYSAPAKTEPARKATSSRKSLVSLASLLLSCIILVFCAVGVIDAIRPAEAPALSPAQDSITLSEHSDPAALSLIFPMGGYDATIQE